MGCHFLFQGIFPTLGWNPCLIHWQVDSLSMSHWGSPIHVCVCVNIYVCRSIYIYTHTCVNICVCRYMYTYTYVWWQAGVLLGSLHRGLCWTSLVSWGCRIYHSGLQRQEDQLKNVWLVFGTRFGATCSMPAYTPLHQTAEYILKFEMCLKCHSNKMVLWGRHSRST